MPRTPTYHAVVWELNCRAETFDVRIKVQNVEVTLSRCFSTAVQDPRQKWRVGRFKAKVEPLLT